MRTEPLSPLAQTLARVRGQTRRIVARAPALTGRWLIGLAALAVLAVIGYVANATPSPVGAYVRSGTKFSDDDVLAIAAVLNTKHLPFRIVDDGRIEVSSDRLDDANDAIAKLEVGPRRLGDIDKKRLESSSLLDTPDERRERVEKESAERMAGFIERLDDGIVSAWVTVNRSKPRDGRRVIQGASAFVRLETRGKRVIPHRVVRSIQELIVGLEPEVKTTAITIMDQTGHSYLDAQNPSIGALSRLRAREEEYRDEIAKKLDWVRGAEVSVQLVPSPDAVPIQTTSSPRTTKPPEPPPAIAAEEIRLPEPPKMSMNQPVDADPEPVPDASPTIKPKSPSHSTTAPAPVVSQNSLPEDDESARARARVLVTVPRSFYLERTNHREPSLDDLQALMSRTERTVKMAVEIVIPPDRLGTVNVSTIADELPPSSPPPSANIDARRSVSWWVLAGIAGGATTASLGLAFRLMTSRRPAHRVATPDRDRDERGRFKIDEAETGGPGPSERVRELIRQNPEAAASVLHRWTGQGGSIG